MNLIRVCVQDQDQNDPGNSFDGLGSAKIRLISDLPFVCIDAIKK